jgi:hypothetical protein
MGPTVLTSSTATKALRQVFDLQARVGGLRQVGLTEKIAPTMEKELQRYLNWAMEDAGLHHCNFVPNIMVRALDADMGRKQLMRTIQAHFDDWTKEHQEFYAKQPQIKSPPRVLYGLIIIQHAVLLFTSDSARPKVKPRCFADFNMATERQWLDSGLNVAIPILVARERLLPIVDQLPAKEGGNSNDGDL